MDLNKNIEVLIEKRKKLIKDSNDKSVVKQHEGGKFTARERLDLLFDEGSFSEIDAFAETRATDFGMQDKKVAGDGVVTGYGYVNGRLVYVSAQDFTVIGGSLGEMHAAKITKVMDMAMKMGAPFISINDSGGARIQEGIDSLKGFGDIFYRNTLASGVIPQISVIMGPCAGGAVYSPAIADFIFMVDQSSHMFITGPDVVRSVTGEDVSFETLGGGAVHSSKSGVAHFNSVSEEDCIEDIKRLISFLPDNNLNEAEVVDMSVASIEQSALDTIIPEDPNKAYDMIDVVESVLDNQDFLEIQENFAKNIVIGFGRIDGKTVGIVANQPSIMAGVLDINSADKASRFIRFCDAFNIPLISFTDVPGYLPGVGQEHGGVIRHGAKLLYAFSEATVPKINVIVRKAYGGAYIAMNSKHLGADMVFAWPSAEIAVMGAEGAANIVFRKEILSSEDQASARAEKIEEYRDKFSGPYVAAQRGYVDEVIVPSETRNKLCMALGMLANKRENRPLKKHGNIPL